MNIVWIDHADRARLYGALLLLYAVSNSAITTHCCPTANKSLIVCCVHTSIFRLLLLLLPCAWLCTTEGGTGLIAWVVEKIYTIVLLFQTAGQRDHMHIDRLHTAKIVVVFTTSRVSGCGLFVGGLIRGGRALSEGATNSSSTRFIDRTVGRLDGEGEVY